MRYPPETRDYSTLMASAEAQVTQRAPGEAACVVVVSYEEWVDMLSAAEAYPGLSSLLCFTARDWTDDKVIWEGGGYLEARRCYTLTSATPLNSMYRELQGRYTQLNRSPFGLHEANQYDIGAIVLAAMLEKQSQRGEDVIPLMNPVCARIFGASGWCRVDENGDRAPLPLDVIGFGATPGGGFGEVRYGVYDPGSDAVTWFTSASG